MKQNIIMIIILIGLFIFGLLIYDFSDELDKGITNSSWYVYDDNELNVISFKDNNFSYTSLNNNSDIHEYKTCKTFRYNRSINVIKLNCSISGNKIYISSFDDNTLNISVNGNNKVLYSSEKLAQEAKFISDNNLSKDEYEDLINVDYSLFNSVSINDLSALIKEKSNNYVVFINNDINYENVFNYLALEKVASNNTIYLINVSSLSTDDTRIINGYNSDFSLNPVDYVKNEIDIYIVGNKKMNFVKSINVASMSEAKNFKLDKLGN